MSMIIKNLRIFSQNIQKNSVIVTSLLESLTQYDIILIQELPWSEIRKILSTLCSKSEPLMGTCHHPNWITYTRIPLIDNDFSRVIAYINICLSSFYFLLCKDIINHRDIGLISFFNNNVCFYILNVYSDSSHSALKYLKDTEVNIDNIILMTGNFNIRDRLWDPSFPFHCSISDDLFIIADSFDLTLSNPTKPCPTRYSNTIGESNSVINLMFLRYGSPELDHHSILLESRLSLDHAPLVINITISEKIIQTSKFTLTPKSEQETAFIQDIISNLKSLNISNIDNINKLEQAVHQVGTIINQAWAKTAKKLKISKHSKQWWSNECKWSLENYRASRSLENWKKFKTTVKNVKRSYFDDKIQEIMNKSRGLWELMNWIK